VFSNHTNKRAQNRASCEMAVRILAVACRSGEESKPNAGCEAISEAVRGGGIGPVHSAFSVVADRHREASPEDVGVVALSVLKGRCRFLHNTLYES
jgi:hypothetical protein